MGRVISNTFSLTAVPDVQATRPNLVHCSQFTKDRLGWWILPDRSNAYSFGVESGMYGIDGYNAYGVLAQPGMIADIRQYLAKEYRASQADYNKETSNYALDAGKWYTLSFKVRGIAKKQNSDGSFSDGGDTRLYVYLVGYNGGGVSIVDTSEKYIVDGVEKSPSGDMNTSFVLNWTVSTHTITFKTRSDLKTISNHAVPVLYFRSFGEGHTTYPTYFANGGCLFRIAAIKIEEGMEATAYTPHATEMQPPVHAVAFKRDNTNISGTTPTGGTYTSPTPTGWSDGIPSGEARLWETKAVFVPELSTATLSAVTWSKPSPVGDTSDSDVEFSPYDGTPVSDVSNNLAAAGTVASPTTNKWFDPVRNAGADFTKMIWRAERQKRNGVWDEKWAIVKVKGETGKKGENGKDAVTLDLDNQMDSISVDSYGNVKLSQTVTTHATIFKGATAQSLTSGSVTATSINGVDAEITYSGGIATISYTFQPTSDGFDDKHYTSDISVTYGGVTYKATFTLAPVRDGADGKNAVIYNVHPSLTSCPFSRTSTNGYSPTSYSLTCGYVCNNGGISTTVANATKSFNNGWHIFYRINSSGTWGDWNLYKKAVSVIYNHRSVEFCIAKTSNVQELIDDPYDSLIVDREAVPVVVGGSNGTNGTSAFTVDLDNEMDAIPCNHNGYLGTAKTYNLNIGAYLGTSSLTITGCIATVSPANAGITVDTSTKNAPVVNVSSSYPYTGSYTITFEVTTAQGTRNVVFTLATQRAGSDGESPVVYQLMPSHTSLSFSRNADGTLSGSYTVSCKVSQTIGSGTATGDADDFGLNIKYGTSDSDLKTYPGALTIGTSYAAYSQLIFELWNGTTTRLDRETIPILKDGSNGTDGKPGTPGSPGADATVAWLDCPYSAIRCGSNGISKITQFVVKAYRRTGDDVQATDSSYGLSYTVTHTDSSGNEVNGNSGNSTRGDITVTIGTDYKLKDVVINLSYGNKIIQTLTLIPVLDGPMGEQGYNYVPEVLGVWDASQQYVWNNTVRQGCLYPKGGVYYCYVVAERFKNPPIGTEPTNTAYWEEAGQYKTIFAEAVYTPNANIGGFYLTNKLFMSSERAGQFVYVNNDYRYQGLWNETFTYKTRRIVYYRDNEDNGYYYVSKKSVIAGARPTNTSYWDKIVTGSPILAENKVEYLLKAVAGKPIGISFEESRDLGIWITAVSDTSSGYKTVRKNKNGEGWLIFFNNGTNSNEPTPENNGWRYLTDTEYALLGITPSTANMEYEFKKVDIPRYVINGSAGIPATFMPDGSVWTYDGTGKQTIGNPEKQRLELTPSDGGLSFFGSDGSRVVTIDATSLTSSNLYGSNSGSFTLNTAANYSSYSVNLAENTKKHKMTSQNVVLTGRVEISYSGTMSCFASLPSVTSNPRSYCSISLNVCRIKTDDYGVEQVTVVREIASLYSGGIAKNNNISGSVSFDADGSTYSIYAIASYRQYYSGSELRYYLSLSECKYSNKSSITRVHANGFALGDASNNHFAAYNNNGVKMTAVNANAKLDFSSSGLSYTKGSYGGLLPITIWMGYVKLTDTSATITRRYGTISLNVTFESKGNCKLTLPSGFNMDNTFPTITTFQTLTNGANGVSAMIKEWSGTTMKIELNNDGSTADTAGFFLKLEYYA